MPRVFICDSVIYSGSVSLSSRAALHPAGERAAARALIPGRVLRIGGALRGKRLPGGCPGDGKRQLAGPCDFSPPPLACPRPAVGSRRAAPARAALHGRAGSRLRQLHPPRGREQQPPAPGRVHSLQLRRALIPGARIGGRPGENSRGEGRALIPGRTADARRQFRRFLYNCPPGFQRLLVTAPAPAGP